MAGFGIKISFGNHTWLIVFA